MVDFAALGTTEEDMQKKLSKIKIKLFLYSGAAFLGSIMSQTRFIWDDSPECDTAWTDGITIGFNPAFWLKIPDEAKVTVLAHELWHIAYQHVLRLKEANRDPERRCDHGRGNQTGSCKYSAGDKIIPQNFLQFPL